MKSLSRRALCAVLPGWAMSVLPAFAGQVHASESPVPQMGQPGARTVPAGAVPGEAVVPSKSAAAGTLTVSRAIGLDQMPVRTMANGGESRDIVHGTLATGETVNLHQSMQVVGAVPNPMHVIQHSEFILVREGELEFQREGAEAERVGPGGVLFVAFGTKHTVKNVGAVPARYFVVAIGGDAR